jgi:hypothetical protein
MRDTLIVEVDHRPESAREESARRRDEGYLNRQLMRYLDQQRAFEAGVAAGIEIVARGTRDDIAADETTAPYPVLDPDLID